LKIEDDSNHSHHNENPLEIKPIPFRPPRKAGRSSSRKSFRWLLVTILGAAMMLLCASAWFVFTARQVVVRVVPEPAKISVGGGILAPRIGEYFLLRPGLYQLRADQDCFEPLERQLKVTEEKSQVFDFTMTRQPGRLNVQAHQADAPSLLLEGALISIDGNQAGRTPLSEISVQPGTRQLSIAADDYQTQQAEVEVAGCNKSQEINLALVPAWAEISLQSEPPGAAILVDGQAFGATPSTIRLMHGEHDIELQADRYKPWRTRLTVIANQPESLDSIKLQPADGRLEVRTEPSGANVLLGGTFAGQTPLLLPLAADETHLVQISRAGYENVVRKVKLNSGESKALEFALKPITGTVNFVVRPADAELYVDGKPVGKVPSTLKLVAVEHELEIKKQGYQTHRTRLTPRPGYPQQVNIELLKLASASTQNIPQPVIRTKNGYELKLIEPQPFIMGSSRREQGRRSNETLRRIELRRPFYMGIREVTNKEFRQFMSGHNSGTFRQHDLGRDDLPVVQVNWLQAALYCNWLSIQESLPPVYIQQDGRVVAADPLGTGYRLPTEAEWEFSARFHGNKAELKYPWGDSYPPPARAGNFADVSAKDLLTNHLASYNDGYAVSAPPATFKPNGLGLYDLAGNVSEWSHDYYTIYPYDDRKIYLDPAGPQTGEHHVIKGSSWRQAGISELRNSYRDYSDAKRVDLGFRVCRYVK